MSTNTEMTTSAQIKTRAITKQDVGDPYDEGGRVSLIEAIGYTAVLGFIALLASGLFDGMVAWQ
jgi:hypothetical protein